MLSHFKIYSLGKKHTFLWISSFQKWQKLQRHYILKHSAEKFCVHVEDIWSDSSKTLFHAIFVHSTAWKTFLIFKTHFMSSQYKLIRTLLVLKLVYVCVGVCVCVCVYNIIYCESQTGILIRYSIHKNGKFMCKRREWERKRKKNWI